MVRPIPRSSEDPSDVPMFGSMAMCSSRTKVQIRDVPLEIAHNVHDRKRSLLSVGRSCHALIGDRRGKKLKRRTYLLYNMSDDDLITYCGLYCGLCAERCAIPHMAKELMDLVKEEGYDYFYEYVPGMKEHYPSFIKVLQDLSEMDCKCRDGRGGPPNCEIRICAKGRDMFVCMDCHDFPCEKLNALTKVYPFLTVDASRYQEIGKERWLEEQKAKARKGFNYSMMRRIVVLGPEDGKKDD
jgi:hypothetical protein